MINGNGWTGQFIFLIIIAMIVGWGVIETLRWLFSFIHISFG